MVFDCSRCAASGHPNGLHPQCAASGPDHPQDSRLLEWAGTGLVHSIPWKGEYLSGANLLWFGGAPGRMLPASIGTGSLWPEDGQRARGPGLPPGHSQQNSLIAPLMYFL